MTPILKSGLRADILKKAYLIRKYLYFYIAILTSTELTEHSIYTLPLIGNVFYLSVLLFPHLEKTTIAVFFHC